jgi:hypothetical protein
VRNDAIISIRTCGVSLIMVATVIKFETYGIMPAENRERKTDGCRQAESQA